MNFYKKKSCVTDLVAHDYTQMRFVTFSKPVEWNKQVQYERKYIHR